MKDLKELNILLAEDNPINQRIAVITFRQLGIVADIASNGREAVNMYQKKNYDLIFMDMQMPIMDGLEATRQIRAIENISNLGNRVLIVALTANIISDKKEDCIQAGMDDFIEKPFQEITLRDLFSKIFK